MMAVEMEIIGDSVRFNVKDGIWGSRFAACGWPEKTVRYEVIQPTRATSSGASLYMAFGLTSPPN